MRSSEKTGWLATAAVICSLLTSHSQTAAVELASPPPQSPNPSAPSDLSPATGEVVRLAGSGVGEDVLTAFVQNSQVPYGLTATHVLYLKDLGLSSQVITAMLNRDSELKYPSQSYPPAAGAAPVTVPAAQPTVVAAPVYVGNAPAVATYFYDDLSPYGTWVDLPGYGWCWQPSVVGVNRSWRPYCDAGHWIYTDAGWYWQSDYSWGWAPFHYGRWHLHERCGWVWLPDTTWAPAWVTWRVADDRCGWAPLPPHADFDLHSGYRFNGGRVSVDFDFGLHPDHFTFVAFKDFCEHDLGHRQIPPTEVTKIYNHTTIINNYVVNNNTVVNRGVSVERVAAVSHTQIQKAVVRDLPADPAARTRLQTAATSEAVVYRPELKAARKPVAMVAQKIDDRHPVVQHSSPALPKAERTSGSGTGSASAGAPTQTVRQDSSVRVAAPSSVGQKQRPASPAASKVAVNRPAQDSRQPVPAEAVYHAGSDPSLHPLRARGATAANTVQTKPEPPAQKAHVYPPKSASQAAEVRSLPPVQTRSTSGSSRDNQ